MDEACAHVRVELDSKPAALDGSKRKILQLEIEATALEQEQSWNIFAKENPRLATVRAKLVELHAVHQQMEQDYEAQKSLLKATKKTRVAKHNLDTSKCMLITAVDSTIWQSCTQSFQTAMLNYPMICWRPMTN